MVIAAGAFEPFYLRIFVLDRTKIRAAEIELPYHKLAGSRAFLAEVRARTQRGEVVAIAAPFATWDGGYEYLYARSLYPLAGRLVLPLMNERSEPRRDSLTRANVVAAYHSEPKIDGFSVVWRGPDGVLMRRAR
jgi:hypothetical protein